MQIGMGFGKFLARVLFQELGVSVPSSVFHVLFITRSLHAKKKQKQNSCKTLGGINLDYRTVVSGALFRALSIRRSA
jgi:hypothetical protein